MKNESHTHLFVFGSQWAPIPHTTPSHLCLQRPLMQMYGSVQGSDGEQRSLIQADPGNGFPTKPSKHLQEGPLLVGMHCAPSPHK